MEVGILGLLVDDPVDVRGGMLLDCMGLRAVPAHCPELGTNPQRARRNLDCHFDKFHEIS